MADHLRGYRAADLRLRFRICKKQLAIVDQLPRLEKRELICLLSFTCNYVVSVRRGFLFHWVLGMGCVILLWRSMSLPYNHFLVTRSFFILMISPSYTDSLYFMKLNRSDLLISHLYLNAPKTRVKVCAQWRILKDPVSLILTVLRRWFWCKYYLMFNTVGVSAAVRHLYVSFSGLSPRLGKRQFIIIFILQNIMLSRTFIYILKAKSNFTLFIYIPFQDIFSDI